MVLLYLDGIVRRACVLSFCGNVIRLALEGSEDAVEFVMQNGVWRNEEGAPVSLGFSRALTARAGTA